MEKNENKEFSALLSFRSVNGILFYLADAFLLLAIIGVFCPFVSYNPTVFDETNRTVSLFGMSWAGVLAGLFLVGEAVCLFVSVMLLCKADWRAKQKTFTVLEVCAVLCAALCVIFSAVAYLLYEIPEEEFAHLELHIGAGMYLVLIGALGAAAALLGFFVLLKKIIQKGLPADALRLGGKTPKPETGANASLEEKLRGLVRLREQGLIGEEEFQEKKKELLEKHCQ